MSNLVAIFSFNFPCGLQCGGTRIPRQTRTDMDVTFGCGKTVGALDITEAFMHFPLVLIHFNHFLGSDPAEGDG